MPDFKLTGFPDNEEFEVPDDSEQNKKPSRNIRMQFDGEDIPPEFLNILGRPLTKDSLKDFVEFMEEIEKSIDSIEGGSENIKFFHSDVEDFFALSVDDRFLISAGLGFIPCCKSENLFEDFKKRYGEDSRKFLGKTCGIEEYLANDYIFNSIDCDDFEDMQFVEESEYFILFYMQPKDPQTYGIYAGAIKQEDGSFVLYIPDYGNSMLWSKDKSSMTLYNVDQIPEVFPEGEENVNKDMKSFCFFYNTVSAVHNAISFALCPIEQQTLITPKEFGTISNVHSSYFKDSDMLLLGKIKPNNSSKTKLFLKDFEIEEAEEYNIYAKLNEVLTPANLSALASIFRRIDLNESDLLDHVELKCSNDKKMYFELKHFD